jgi:hypothetical protein
MEMKSRFRKLAAESLEGRSVLSTVAYGDLNHDGLPDMVAITSPTKVTFSLANPDGSFTESAIFTVPKKQAINYVSVYDNDGDGDLDIYASGPAGGDWMYTHNWLGNGDGTFDSPTSGKWRWPKGNHGGF